MVVLDACALFDNEGRRVEGRYFNPDHPINRQLRPPSGDRPTPEQYASYDNWHTWNFNNENTGWSDEEGLSDAAWEGSYRGPHSPQVNLQISEPTNGEDLWRELEVVETRYRANREGTERLQERIERPSMELGGMRAALGIIFDTLMRLARDLLPLLRSDLDVLYCFSVDGDYELCLRPDLGEEDLLSAHRIFDEFRQASQAKSEALRKEDDFLWEHVSRQQDVQYLLRQEERRTIRREGELFSQWAAFEPTLQRGWGWDSYRQRPWPGNYPHRVPGRLTRWTSTRTGEQDPDSPASPPRSPEDMISPASYKAFARLFLYNRYSYLRETTLHP
eukprot:gene26665-32750_t